MSAIGCIPNPNTNKVTSKITNKTPNNEVTAGKGKQAAPRQSYINSF